MQEFDPRDLAAFDGSDAGKPVYVVLEGKVYDVSASKLWRGGMHMRRHRAGCDLTLDFSAAPHGPEVLKKVVQAGVLAEKGAADQRLPAWLAGLLARFPMLGRHPHPMLVHYPIALMFVTAGFNLLALATGSRALETTAFHCLAAGLLFTPFAIATGLFTWWLNYQARPLRPVRIKIWVSALLLLDAAIIFFRRWTTPDILFSNQASGTVYILLICALVPLVSIIGWFGATLTFPVEKARKTKD